MLCPGTFFGETAVVDGGPELSTVTALTPMLLRVATPEEFDQLSEVRVLAWAILQKLATRQHLALSNGSRLTSAGLADPAASNHDDEAAVESTSGARARRCESGEPQFADDPAAPARPAG